MKKELFWLIIFLSSFISFSVSTEEKAGMSDYYYPFCNRQLNSFIDRNTQARGKLAYEISFGRYHGKDRGKALFLINNDRLIAELKGVTLLIDLKSRKIIKWWGNDKHAFVFKGENGDICNTDNGILSRISMTDLSEEKLGHIFFECNGIPELNCLYLEDGGMLVGLNMNHFPQDSPTEDFFILKAEKADNNGSLQNLKKLIFDRSFARLPMTTDNKLLIPQVNGLTVFATNCDKIASLTLDFTPYMLSVGPDNLIYLFAYKGEEKMIVCMEQNGLTRWKKIINTFRLAQPPVVSAKSMVILMEEFNYKSKIEAFKENRKLWEYELEGGKALATVLNDETILVIDGPRLLHLDDSGKLIWCYENKRGLPFRSQPIVDAGGNIFVSTDESVLCIK